MGGYNIGGLVDHPDDEAPHSDGYDDEGYLEDGAFDGAMHLDGFQIKLVLFHCLLGFDASSLADALLCAGPR